MNKKTMFNFLCLIFCFLVSGCHKDFRQNNRANVIRGIRAYSYVDLKFTPPRVFDEKLIVDLDKHTGSYFEATFDESGLIVKLKHVQEEKEFWTVSYNYSDTGELLEEKWEENGVVRIRKF